MRRNKKFKLNHILYELRQHRNTCALHGVTFTPGILESNKAQVSREFKKDFLLWWDSWIAPKLDEIQRIAETL